MHSKRDLQKRPTKESRMGVCMVRECDASKEEPTNETCKRDLQKRPTKETYKRVQNECMYGMGM